MIRDLTAKCRSFGRDESGVSTVWALYWTVIFLIMAGFVIDASNAYRYRIVLQATADSSSLGAIMSYRESKYYNTYINGDPDIADGAADDAGRGTEVAMTIAENIMGQKQNKIVVGESQVEFGNWDGSTFNTEVDPEDVDAARVTALRTRANGNELRTLLLNMFNGLDAWDVGAVAIAHFKQDLCPQKEGIMAGNMLDIDSNAIFSGVLCLHGEQKVNVNNNNTFGPETTLSYGAETNDFEGGEACLGMGNCDEQKVIDANPGLNEDNLGAVAGIMPRVPDMFLNFQKAIADPIGVVLGDDPDLPDYIPEALLATYTSETTSDGTTKSSYKVPTEVSDLITVDDGGKQVVDRVIFDDDPDAPIIKGGDRFQAYLDAGPSEWVHGVDDTGDGVMDRPLRPHTIYEVYGCSSNGTLSFGGDELTAVVVATDCRIEFETDLVMNRSTILTSYGDPGYNEPLDPLDQENDYTGKPAFSGSEGTKIGTGTCDEPVGASKLIAAGDINVASGMEVRHSQLLTKGDMLIAAQADATQGITAWAWGDIKLTSLGEWNGCEVYNSADQTVPGIYRLVY